MPKLAIIHTTPATVAQAGGTSLADLRTRQDKTLLV